MLSDLHQVEHFSKQFEIALFDRPQWILTKKWNDLFAEISHRSNAEPIKMFLMVVVAAVNVDSTTTEELLKRLKSGQAFGSLGHNELRKNLPAQLNNPAPLDRHGETTFSIDKANDPSDCF